MKTRRHTGNRDGFALMAALWLVVLIGVSGYELSVHSRGRRLAVANALESEQGVAAAEAGLESGRAMLEVLGGARPARAPLPSADTITLGDVRTFVRVIDGGALVQLNRASETELTRLMVALRMDASTASRLAQRILDWRDADDLERGRGAERDDYLRAGARRLPPNADFIELADLRDVDGVTSAIFQRIAPYLKVHGSGQVNVSSAPREVLLTLDGIGAEAVDAIVRAREAGRPFRTLEELSARVSPGARQAIVNATPELSSRATFELSEAQIESTGWVDGSAIRVRASSVHERSGEAWLTTWRRVER
jgi:general secretion pathway protein K